MSDFSDRPFVAGSVTGLRAFKVDQLGRLTGVTFPSIWTPGENVAQCLKVSDGSAASMYLQQMTAYGYNLNTLTVSHGGFTSTPMRYFLGADPTPGVPQDRKPKKEKVIEAAAHSVAGVDCQCGFYAYFDGGNDYLGNGNGVVGAIVEGWGVCTVGSRGFRAEKASIKALIFPDSQSTRLAVMAERVRRNYPDARQFTSEVDAVTAFPLTEPFPASPEDDDFWTRSAS